jgi:hypothetical protein
MSVPISATASHSTNCVGMRREAWRENKIWGESTMYHEGKVMLEH